MTRQDKPSFLRFKISLAIVRACSLRFSALNVRAAVALRHISQFVTSNIHFVLFRGTSRRAFQVERKELRGKHENRICVYCTCRSRVGIGNA